MSLWIIIPLVTSGVLVVALLLGVFDDDRMDL
jgi:hypothetical protein